MILTSMIALAVIQQSNTITAQDTTPKAAPIIAKMFKRYFNAKTLTGSITYTQSMGNDTGKLETQVQYERPYLLYIKQTRSTTERREWIVTSDGNEFSYDVPDRLPIPSRRRLVETQIRDDGTLKVGDIYFAAGESLGDRSTPLDIAIAGNRELTRSKDHWATLKYEGQADLGGQKVHVITGQWRAYANKKPSAEFRMLITEEGDLKQYSTKQITILDQRGGQKTLINIWDVNLTVDGTPDKSLFKVIKKI